MRKRRKHRVMITKMSRSKSRRGLARLRGKRRRRRETRRRRRK
jgi:hypothetical protein